MRVYTVWYAYLGAHTHTHIHADVHALEALKSRRHPADLADGEDNKERKTVVDRCLQGGCKTGVRGIKRPREKMRRKGRASAAERAHITSSSQKEQKEEEEETAKDEEEEVVVVCQ